MITKETLEKNLNRLRKQVPVKPETYTTEHPRTMKEALHMYANRRTVHSVENCTNFLNNEHWPLPLWWNPDNIKAGFFNRLYYRKHFQSLFKRKFNGFDAFDLLWAPFINQFHFKIKVDDTIEEAFEANKKYLRKRLLSNPLLESKKIIVTEIFRAYQKKHWVACISTIFPLMDFVARKLLKTNNLSADVSRICKLFSQNGFSQDTTDHLMPHMSIMNMHDPDKKFSKEERDLMYEKVKDNHFGVIGPALSSFLRFANTYYGYYKEDEAENNSLLNRHAILHGSVAEFGSKVNCVKLISFLYLFLELEPVFAILFEEET